MKRTLFPVRVACLALTLAALLTGCSAKDPQGTAGSSDPNTLDGGSQQTSYITLEEARRLALTHAGVESDAAEWREHEYDLEDGTPFYELEFHADGIRHEYTVHAVTGQIVEYDRESLD